MRRDRRSFDRHDPCGNVLSHHILRANLSLDMPSAAREGFTDATSNCCPSAAPPEPIQTATHKPITHGMPTNLARAYAGGKRFAVGIDARICGALSAKRTLRGVWGK